MYNPLDAVSYVISTVGAPFAQALVNRATLDFTEANITQVCNAPAILHRTQITAVISPKKASTSGSKDHFSKLVLSMR